LPYDDYIDYIHIDYIHIDYIHIDYIHIDYLYIDYINHSLLPAKWAMVLECKFISQPHQWRDRGHRIAR
jgi:hypothetical protein